MKRFLSVLLSLCIVLSCFASLGITVFAVDALPIPITYDTAVTSGYVVEVKTQEDFKAVYSALNLYKQAEEFQNVGGHVSILMSPSSNVVIDNDEPTVYDLSGTSLHLDTNTNKYTFTIGKNTSMVGASYFEQTGFSSDVIVEGKLSVAKCEFYRNLTIAETGTLEVTGKDDSSFAFSYFVNNGVMKIRNSNVSSSKDDNCENNGQIYTPDLKLYDLYRQKDVPLTGGGSLQKLITNELNPDANGGAEGSTPLSISGTAIAEPTYTVTIPKNVDFGNVTHSKTSHIETKTLTVSAEGISNLFANQKKLVVTVAGQNGYTLSDGAAKPNILSYQLYTEYIDEANNTPLANGLVLEMQGTAEADTNLSQTISGAVTIDTSNIKKAGSYTDILTFTVALQEVNG